MYDKKDKNEMIASCKFSSKYSTNYHIAHISEGASSWTTDPYQDHMIFSSLEELKPQSQI